MGDPYGLVTWPGMVAFESASITLIHGITPSVAQIAMQPQDGNVDIDGTMTFEYDGMTKTFINCHADYGSFRWDESGAVWEIAIFDRRWWWRFGWVAGEYNIVMPDAKLKMDTEKAPQDLAKLCLKAMGEDDWDVGDLPNDSRPLRQLGLREPSFGAGRPLRFARLLHRPGVRFKHRQDLQVGPRRLFAGWRRVAVVGDNRQPRDADGLDDSSWSNPFPVRFFVGSGVRRKRRQGNHQNAFRQNLDLHAEQRVGEGRPAQLLQRSEGKGRCRRGEARRSVWRWYRVKIPTGGINVAGYSNTIKSRDCVLLKPLRCEIPRTKTPSATMQTESERSRRSSMEYGGTAPRTRTQ